MNFNFGEVLASAWQIIWKRRVLWIFGILAGCSRGGSSVNWNFNDSSGYGGFNGTTPNLPPQIEQLFQFMVRNAAGVIALTIGIICIFWIVALFLGTIGRIGLIRGTLQAESGGETGFGQLFSESLPYFWRVFGLSVLVGLPLLFAVGALIAAMFALIFGASLNQGNDGPVLGFLAIMPFILICICLLVPVSWIISLIVRQAERAIVLDNAGVLPAFSRGWGIFRDNLGPIFVMAIILAVIGFAVGLVLTIPVLLVVVPFTYAFLVGNFYGNGPNWNVLAFAFACMCILTPVLWLVRGIMVAYIESAWTLTYMRITRPPDSQPVVLEANA